ncbi:MAG: substrate-binding domain-containing protein, partial [Clostridia bacterium]|nr:substrate-binding domain-containing protein [Clostridia bacterium]
GEELSEPREQSFIAAMKEYNDCAHFVYDSPFRFERAGEDGAEKVTEKFPECTALICAYDNIAFGAMKSLKEKGFRIPEDFSVIGVDNLNPIRDATPPLSSIACDTEEICQIAWELLEKRMKNPRSGSRQHIVMKCRVFLRDSVGEARKTKL